MRKPIHRSKTMWVSLAIAVLGVVFDNFSEIRNILDERYYGPLLILIGATMAILRFYTKDQE